MGVLMCVHECNRIWCKCESGHGCACMCVCGSSSGLLKACWEACHCKSGKRKSPKCTEEQTHHPPLCLSSFLHYSWSLIFSHTLIYESPLSQSFLHCYNFLGGKKSVLFQCFLLLIIICCPGLLVFLNWGLKSINWVKYPSRSEKID